MIPTPVTNGFWIATLVGLICATAGLMWFLLALGLSPSFVVIGGLAFALLPPATGFTLWDYMLVDPLAFALLTLALACAVSRRGLWLFVTLALYAFAKETVLLVALFTLVYALEERDWRMLRWSAAGLAACSAIQLGLHVAIHSDQPYSLLAQYQLVRSMYGGSAVTVLARILDTFGAPWLLLLPFAALQLIHPPRVLARPSFLLMFIGATAQVVVATNTSRVVVYAFPIVIAAFLYEIKYLAMLARIPHALLGGSVLAAHLLWFIQQAALVSPAMLSVLTTGVVAVEFATVFATISVSACAAYYWARRLGTVDLPP